MCSNMNAIFVVSATIYYIGFIISSAYCLGASNLIEFVEEWGCYDSEIRLTCGHLDSKIAILEATFTPNCTDTKCIKGDLKRLMRGHSTSKHHSSRSAETEAARRFLETLRKSDLESNAEVVDTIKYENTENEKSSPRADYLIGAKEKRSSLRASLERLIVKYLRQISPGEKLDALSKRLKRFRRALFGSTETDAGGTGETSDRVMIGSRNVSFGGYELSDSARSNEERYRKYYETRRFCPEQKRKIGALSRLVIDDSLRKVNDTRQNIRRILNKRCSGKNHCSFLFAADDPLAVLWDSGLVHIKYVCMDDYHTNHYCNEHLTIGYDNSLKRRDVPEQGRGEPVAEALVQARSDQSFHSVKILKANEEDAEKMPNAEDDESDSQRKSRKLQKHKKKEKGIYSQDFRVLKILPSNLEDFNDIEEIGDEIYFRTDDASTANTREIFPSVLVPTALTLASDPPSLQQTSSELHVPVSTAGYSNSLEKNSDRFSSTHNENRNDDLSKFENITLIIREGEQYFIPFTKPRELDSLTALNQSTTTTAFPFPAATSTATTTATTTILSSTSSITTSSSSILYPTLQSSTLSPPSAIIATTISTANPPLLLLPPKATVAATSPASSGVAQMTFVESAAEDDDNDDGGYPYGEILLSAERHDDNDDQEEEIKMRTNEQEMETALPTVGELSMEASNRQYTTVIGDFDNGGAVDRTAASDDNGNVESIVTIDDNDDESLEPGYYGNVVRLQYKSIQRTYYGPPKPQGFTMTPGYPKFYIGECECKWKILAPVMQKIRLIILDISLRYEKKCQDYLQITDLISKKQLFKSCEEPNWPIEILSSSNEVEIVVKAATKFAYPKRGVLIHYSALGCLTPPPPVHGRFVERTDALATFECEPSFVFPDSAISTRQLLCTDEHIWNGTLPDCVEEDAISESGIVSGIDFRLHKTESTPSVKMGHAETDTVFDIIVPSILIVALFAINAVIFIIIMKQRKRSTSQMDAEAKELAEL